MTQQTPQSAQTVHLDGGKKQGEIEELNSYSEIDDNDHNNSNTNWEPLMYNHVVSCNVLCFNLQISL